MRVEEIFRQLGHPPQEGFKTIEKCLETAHQRALIGQPEAVGVKHHIFTAPLLDKIAHCTNAADMRLELPGDEGVFITVEKQQVEIVFLPQMGFLLALDNKSAPFNPCVHEQGHFRDVVERGMALKKASRAG